MAEHKSTEKADFDSYYTGELIEYKYDDGKIWQVIETEVLE